MCLLGRPQRLKCVYKIYISDAAIIKQSSMNCLQIFLTVKKLFVSFVHFFCFILGNDAIYQLTKDRNLTLYLSITLMNNTRLYQIYESFSIADETNQYRLHLGGETHGTLGKTKQLYYFYFGKLYWNGKSWEMKQKAKKFSLKMFYRILTFISSQYHD